MVVAATGSINFSVGQFFTADSFFYGENTFVTPLVTAASQWRRPQRGGFDRKSRNSYTPSVFDVPQQIPVKNLTAVKFMLAAAAYAHKRATFVCYL